MSVVLEDSRSKSWLYHFIDLPGHPGFSDEVSAGIRVSDGMLLVIDCVEGVTFYTERLIQEAIKNGLKIVVVLNKIDRLVLELKLPPNDAYYKINHTLDQVNLAIKKFSAGLLQDRENVVISPLNQNVVFASSMFGCCFTIHSFSKIYTDMLPSAQSTKYQKHS